MPVLSDKDIATIADLYFFDKEKTKIATAIAIAESGGNTNAHNNNPATGDDSYGLWQINMLGRLGTERRAKFGLRSNTELYDAGTNAKLMASISSSGTNWSPWSVYKNGTYKQYLDRAASVSGDLSGTAGPFGDLSLGDVASGLNPLSAFQSLIGPLQSLLNIVFDSAKWIGNPNNWLRILQVSGGIVLTIGAATIVAKPSVDKYIVEPAGRLK